jgi:carbamate kinase
MGSKIAVVAIGGNSLIKDRRHGLAKQAVTVVTQVEVAADDPAFRHPSKPIGSFMDEEQARLRRERDGWDLVEDANRGWQRVVNSPTPLRIVELEAVKRLIEAGMVVITVGGGGIPVVAGEQGDLEGVAAMIDKDLASSLLATELGAELLVISTAVERVALDFGRPGQRWVDHLTLDQAKGYLAEGVHFAAGSMAPKVEAIVGYLERGGTEALVTNPENVERALAGETGTRFTRT